jgi:hypothetical protein
MPALAKNFQRFFEFFGLKKFAARKRSGQDFYLARCVTLILGL